MDLSDQVAIVTGAGRGIGREIALALATAGARVAVTSRTRSELAETAKLAGANGSRMLVVPSDVTEYDALRSLATEVNERLGPVTLLVNNAGTYDPAEPSLWQADPERWWTTMEVNLKGPLLCTRAILPQMLERGHGRVLNVGSDNGVTPLPLDSYSLSKAALIRFTETLAISLAEAGSDVKAFSIGPGMVRTAMTQHFADHVPAEMWTPIELTGKLATRLASGAYDALNGRYLSVQDDLDELLKQAEEIKTNERA